MQYERTNGARRGLDESLLQNLSPAGLRRFEALQDEYPIIRQLRFIAFGGSAVNEDDLLDAFEQMAKGAQARTRAYQRRPRV